MSIVLQGILLIVGFCILVKGADIFVEGAAGIAEKCGIPQIVIGLTICAFGTSAPEAAISISAALKGNAALTIGNVVGSNIINILLILGITAVLTPVAIQKNTFRYEIPFVIFVTVLLLGLGMAGQSISFLDGIILWIFMLLFLGYLFFMSKNGETDLSDDIPKEAENKNIFKLIGITVLGIVLIIWGSDITVDSATEIAKICGMSDRLIGLTIVAFGTSLPELITSVTAGLKGKADIAIGNIVGSNIFNILFVVGTTACLTPIAFASNFLVDGIIAILAALILLLCVARKQKLTKLGGIWMLLCYAAYFVYLLL